jgi:hypothetical protein
MSKQCKNCLEVYADNSMYCANCGSPLVDTTAVDSALNVGDGNAICGGINVNRSNNITSHDSYYNSTTIHERAKSDSEIKLEAVNQLRGKAEEILTNRGRIDSIAIGQLRPLALQLGLDDATFKTIVKEVRSCRNEGGVGLSAVNSRYLQHAQQAVQTNDWDMLLGLKVRLEAMATISPDDDVQYLYHMMLSLLTPLRCIEAYEHQTDENYWRLFWTIVSYVSLERYDEVIPLLASFEPPRFDKPEEDYILLEAYYHIMRADNERAQDFLDDIIGKTKDNYGMVHFDYSDGNYHIDFDNGQITVYDFDNSCHAWYMYDLAELWVHGEGWIMFEPDELKRKQFMEDYFAEIVKGYRTETTIEEEMVKKLPLFVMATRIELLVDAFEVERATGENYLDEEDIEEISQCLLEGKIL